MDILYISPEFPPNYANFVRSLHAEGIRVWAVGETDFYSMPADLRACIRWYARTELNNWRKVEQGINELLEVKHAQGFEGAFYLVESHNEAWLRLEAFINERFDIPGITLREVDRLKKKSVMKRIFQESGLRVARGAIVSTVQEARLLAGELGFPVILKPNEGVGAGGTHRVNGPDQLEAVFPELREDYILEEFVEAPIVTYDGLTDAEGNVIFENTLIYGEGLIEYAQGKDTFFFVSRRIPEQLAGVGKSLVRRFDIRRKFFHLNFLSSAGLPAHRNQLPPAGRCDHRHDELQHRRRPLLRLGPHADAPAAGAAGRQEVLRRLHRPQGQAACAQPRRAGRSPGAATRRICGKPAPVLDVMGRYRYIFRCPDEADVRELAAAARQEG